MKTRILSVAALGALTLAACREEIPVPKGPPEARKDYAQVAVAGPVVLDVRANDFDPTGQALTVVSVGTPTAGTAVLNPDQTVTYTPPGAFTGGASFTYVVQDASGNTAESSAHVTVGASTRALYTSNTEDYTQEQLQLYLTDSEHPGVAIPVNARLPLSVGPDISSTRLPFFRMSPDLTHVAYVANPDEDKIGVFDVFVVDLARPGVAESITDLAEGQSARFDALLGPHLTADNRYVVYGALQDAECKNEAYLFDRQNPTVAPVRIHPPMADDESLLAFVISPDGERIVYAVAGSGLGDDDPGGPPLDEDCLPIVDDDEEEEDPAEDESFTRIFSVDRDDLSTRIQINGTQTPGILQNLDNLQLSPVGTLAAYTARENGSTTEDLYVVDYVAGTPPVKLSRTPRSVGVQDFVWTPDGTRIVYRADEIETFTELFIVAVADPGNVQRVSAPVLEPLAVFGGAYQLSPDGSYVVYLRADLDGETPELFAVDLAAPGVATRVNATLGTGEEEFSDQSEAIIAFRLAPGPDRRVLYGVDVPGEAVSRLEVVDLASPGVATVIGDGFTGGNVAIFAFDSTGQNVIYSHDPDEKRAFSLQLVELGAPTVTVRLTTERVPGEEVSSLINLP